MTRLAGGRVEQVEPARVHPERDVIAMVPCVLLHIGLQRFYVRGLTSGVVKG